MTGVTEKETPPRMLRRPFDVKEKDSSSMTIYKDFLIRITRPSREDECKRRRTTPAALIEEDISVRGNLSASKGFRRMG
jgi:hypothetical protein